jgi:hypothetical protein
LTHLLPILFIAFCLVSLSSYFYLESFPDSTKSFNTGYIAHLSFSIVSVITLSFYNIFKRFRTSNGPNILFVVSNLWYTKLTLLILVGLVSSILQLLFFGSISEHIQSFGSGLSRVNFELSSADGGAPGILKILSFASNGSYAAVVIVLSKSVKLDRKLFLFSLLSAISLIFKIVVSIDIASVLLVILGLFYVAIKRKVNILFLLLSILISVLCLNYISNIRLPGFSIFDFVGLYTVGGIVNFGYVIENVDCYGFGFYTFLNPLNFLMSRLNVGVTLSCLGDNWVFNPAQYFFSLLYLDYGLFSFVVLVAFLIFIARSQRRANVGLNIHTAINLHLAIAIFTMSGVTTLRGIEFYFACFVTWYLNRSITSYCVNKKG